MLTLRVALRYLFAKKSHSAVNIISIISVAGVAVATLAIVCVLSVFNGFADLAGDKLSQLDPEIKVYPMSGKVIANADSLAAVLRAVPGVEVAAPTIEENALAVYGNRQMPVVIKGVTDDYDRVTSIRSIVKDDGTFMLSDSLYSYTTLSVGVAMNLQAYPGFYDFIGIYTPKRRGRINPANPISSFRSDSLIVGGVYQVEQPEYDTDMVIMPLGDVRRLLDYDTEATAIEIKSASDADVSGVIAAIREATGGAYKVKDRIGQQETSFRMIEIEKWITFLLLAFILVIASFNVISTLCMLVIEKDDDIAILDALGATRRQISGIFLTEGWLITLIGGVAGIVLGVALCMAQRWGGFIRLGGNHSVMSIDAYPVRVSPGDLIAVFVLVAVTGLVTALVTSLFTRRRMRGDGVGE
ncbi:MAG: FtsX-like permease family protein [Pseudoflavonifractor sp.]|nr:FtsX-like permease family protein [Pseudoflavonifractor sp.]